MGKNKTRKAKLLGILQIRVNSYKKTGEQTALRNVTSPRAHSTPQEKILFSLRLVRERYRSKEQQLNLTSASNWTSLYCEVPCTEFEGLCTKGTHADLVDSYFFVCFTWLRAARLKEYFHLSKAGFFLQQTLVNSGVGRTEEKSWWTTEVNAVYPRGNCITLNIELTKNACLSTKKV